MLLELSKAADICHQTSGKAVFTAKGFPFKKKKKIGGHLQLEKAAAPIAQKDISCYFKYFRKLINQQQTLTQGCHTKLPSQRVQSSPWDDFGN